MKIKRAQDREHKVILVLNCQYDLVFLFFTKRSTFTENIYYNYVKYFREQTIK